MPHVSTERLERGVRGTAKTLEKMHRLVALGKLHPSLQKIATWIRLSVPGDRRGSGKETLDALFRWVRRHGVFQRDPFQIEKIEHPLEAFRPVVELRRAGKYRGPGLFVGDCDTVAGTVLAVLGGILGFHYAWETAKVDASRPDEFSHVWTAFLVGNEWYPLDPSTPGAKPGWRPPVKPEFFKRWPEKPVEEALGMSGMNGMADGRGGPNKFVPGAYVPADYYGSGIPEGWPGTPEVPLPQGSEFEMLVPDAPAMSPANLEKDMDLLKREPEKSPTVRYGDYAEIQAPRPEYVEPRREYIRVKTEMYPRGSRWNQPEKRILYEPRRPYDWASYPQEPDPREESVAMAQPGLIVMEPRMVAAGAGQVPDMVTAPERDAAAKASTGVWDSITKAISAALPGAATALITRVQTRYATRLAKATNRVAGASVVGPETYAAPSEAKPWYASPFLWIGGALVVGGVAYAVTSKPRAPIRRRIHRRAS